MFRSNEAASTQLCKLVQSPESSQRPTCSTTHAVSMPINHFDVSLKELIDNHAGKVIDKWNSYVDRYETLFSVYRNRSITILEIGIQNGGSLEVWSQYFKDATLIVGCDVNSLCSALTFDDSRVTVVVADANSDDGVARILANSEQFDIIIDDGSHTSSDIVGSFCRLVPHLKPGGLYIVEDAHCSYWDKFGGGLFNPYSAQNFFKTLSDVINGEHWGIDVSLDFILYPFFREYHVTLSDTVLRGLRSIEFFNSMYVVKQYDLHEEFGLGARVVRGVEATVESHIAASGSKIRRPDERANSWLIHSISIPNSGLSRSQVASVNVKDFAPDDKNIEEWELYKSFLLSRNLHAIIGELNEVSLALTDSVRFLEAEISLLQTELFDLMSAKTAAVTRGDEIRKECDETIQTLRSYIDLLNKVIGLRDKCMNKTADASERRHRIARRGR